MLRTQAPLTKCRVRWVPDSSMVNPPANAGDSSSSPGLGKTPCSRKWQPTPIFLPWKFHGHRSLAVYSLWGHKESDTTNHPWTRHPTYLFPEECIACLEQLHSEFLSPLRPGLRTLLRRDSQYLQALQARIWETVLLSEGEQKQSKRKYRRCVWLWPCNNLVCVHLRSSSLCPRPGKAYLLSIVSSRDTGGLIRGKDKSKSLEQHFDRFVSRRRGGELEVMDPQRLWRHRTTPQSKKVKELSGRGVGMDLHF